VRPGVDRPLLPRERVWRIRCALEALREAREWLTAAGAPRAAGRVRQALTSAAAALRRAERASSPEPDEEQLEIPAAAPGEEGGNGELRAMTDDLEARRPARGQAGAP